MSAFTPSIPRRGTQRASHLRQVSNGSSNSMYASRPDTATSDTGTVQHDPSPPKLPVERNCTLLVHDEAFSKEDVVLNLDLFPGVESGDVMVIAPLKTDPGILDFQEKGQMPKKDSDNLSVTMQRDRSNSIPKNPGQVKGTRLTDVGERYLFIAKDMAKETKSKNPSLEISVAKHIADVFCLKQRSNVLLTTTDSVVASASHVEMSFKDEYLARSDMWRLTVGELSNKTVFKGQKILFLGSIKAQVTSVYVDGRKVKSAFFSTYTKPIFRSGSARYMLFIQMSREMWDFDSEGSGEIMFTKVVNGFLPALFKKWVSLQVKHLVSIVLFTRVEYDTGLTSDLATSEHDNEYHTGFQMHGNKKPYKDFYRVVVSEMASGSWTTILYQLKREFKFFRKEISMHRLDTMSVSDPAVPEGSMRGVPGTRIEAEPSLAMHGNILEAINLASSQFSYDYIDRDLMRTGISIVVITPCPGVFEVDYETLRMTTETLIGNGIGIDLVCLPKMPLHSVPLFRYRNPQYGTFHEALRLRSLRSEDSTPRQNAPLFGSSFSSLNESLSSTKASITDRSLRGGQFAAAKSPSEWNYSIPHWIDVSFWTGVSQDVLLTDDLGEAGTRHRRKADSMVSNVFPVRCKMYEMEMASVMEHVMTEISVAPLQHDVLFPQMKIGLAEVPGMEHDRADASRLIERDKVYTSLLEFVSGPSKPLVDRHSAPDEKLFYKTLDSFDLTRSELIETLPGARQPHEGKKFVDTAREGLHRRAIAEDPKGFGVSVNEDSGKPKDMSVAGAVMAERNKSEARGIEEMPKPRKESVGSNSTPALKISPIKTPKLGRQISLGKHGFGIAAPKPVTAELQTEHVSAAKPTSGPPKTSEKKKMTTASNMTHQFLNSPASKAQNRPSSSQSEKSKMTPEPVSVDSKVSVESGDAEKNSTSQPMTIKSALQSLDSTNQFKTRSVLGSLYEGIDGRAEWEDLHSLHSLKVDDSHKLFNSKLLAGSVLELPTTLSPNTALSPWLTVINPSNPSANDPIRPSQNRRWQHVFPRPIHTKTMKWKSLCCPASVPLTTEFFPTRYQLETEYHQKPYNISQNAEEELNEVPETREEFLKELIGLRLSHGFQIVVGPSVAQAFGQKLLKIANVFGSGPIAEDGASVFMSMGNIIHQLSCVNETEIEVNMFLRKTTASTPTSPGSVVPAVYNPAIRTTLEDQYQSRQLILGKAKGEYNWNYVDSFIAGFEEEMSENLRFWRARFVLIPVERATQLPWRHGEDNEEEIRLEGIKKLTQMWQRHRFVTPSERRYQSLASRKTKDPNPLDIVYKTDDPSIVVSAELETLPLVETGEPLARRGQLFESERFRQAKLDIATLADAIQAPVERGGVRMQNRRWHFRLHYSCFIGSDMTTWLLENFEDIESREEAVELGNKLMAKDDAHRLKEKETIKENGKDRERDMGIFVHVEKRHPFRDGQYFYQVTGEFAKQRPESRSGWFASRRRDTSVPSTPMSEHMPKDSPRPERSRSSSNHDDRSSNSGTTTPTTLGTGGKRPKVALSKVMKYDVDHRKRSYRTERINLHYDRLHNPDNCYHIRIDWMSVTAKLIEDAVESWATTAERFGLRLVEAPIKEACSITSVHPFRRPYNIDLARQPPDQQPSTYFDANSFAPQIQSSPASRHFYQKAIMKKFNFVLDTEAARNFPSNVDVTYSWGRPDFKYSQYIHRSGVLLAQITDEGNFLLLANRLYNSRTADRHIRVEHADRGVRISSTGYNHGNSDKVTPFSSPMLRPTNVANSPVLRASCDVLGAGLAGSKVAAITTPETIKNDLEAFCQNAELLELFYTEVFEKATPPAATPPSMRSPYASSLLDSNIPALGLPPGLFARDTSPSPMRLSNIPGVGSSMPYMGRRPSTQVNHGGDGARQDSPRGSIAESDKGS